MDTGSNDKTRYLLPANVCLWLGGHSIKGSSDAQLGVFLREHQALFNYCLDELGKSSLKTPCSDNN